MRTLVPVLLAFAVLAGCGGGGGGGDSGSCVENMMQCGMSGFRPGTLEPGPDFAVFTQVCKGGRWVEHEQCSSYACTRCPVLYDGVLHGCSPCEPTEDSPASCVTANDLTCH